MHFSSVHLEWARARWSPCTDFHYRTVSDDHSRPVMVSGLVPYVQRFLWSLWIISCTVDDEIFKSFAKLTLWNIILKCKKKRSQLFGIESKMNRCFAISTSHGINIWYVRSIFNSAWLYMSCWSLHSLFLSILYSVPTFRSSVTKCTLLVSEFMSVSNWEVGQEPFTITIKCPVYPVSYCIYCNNASFAICRRRRL